MKRTLMILLAVTLLGGGIALMQGGSFDVSWFTVDGGSAVTSAGSVYKLRGSIGQPDAGRIGGGPYLLSGGFAAMPLVTSTPRTPAIPALLTPSGGAALNDTTPTLTWRGVVYGYSYQIQIDDVSTFTSPNISDITRLPIYTVDSATPLIDKVWYWRVRATNSLGVNGGWTAGRSFRIDTISPAAPALIAPANGISVTSARPAFSWAAVAGAVAYQMQFGVTNPPTAMVVNANVLTYTPPTPLLLTTYYWQVRARDAAGNLSAWSGPRSVTIISGPTAIPVLYYYTTSTPTLTWGPVTWATGYDLEVDDVPTFASPNYRNSAIPAGTLSITTTPLADGIWYWRVRAKNGSTWGAWSAVTKITIDAP
jgi:hypothetical protein